MVEVSSLELAPKEGAFQAPEFVGYKEFRLQSGLQRDVRVSQVAWSPDGEHILVVVEERHASYIFRNTAAVYVADGSS